MPFVLPYHIVRCSSRTYAFQQNLLSSFIILPGDMYYSQSSSGKGKGGYRHLSNYMYRNSGDESDSKADAARRNIFSHKQKQQRFWLESVADSKGGSEDQDSKGSGGQVESTRSTVMCPMHPCASSPSLRSSSVCDGGYGAIMCLPREEVFRNVQCKGHLWDLCISSDFVQDALDVGGTCGPCPSATEDDLILLGPCPIETRSRSKLGEFGKINLMSMLGGRDGGPMLTPNTDFMSRITVKGVSYTVDPVDGLVLIDETSGASIKLRRDGTITVDGDDEINGFCFDYVISSTSDDGDEPRQDDIKATGVHCSYVLPDTEYKATVTELDLAPQKTMVAPLEPDVDLDVWSINEIIVTNDETGSSTTISSPKSGQAIQLMHGNMTLTYTNDDPPQKIVAYTPNDDALRGISETDELMDSFDYVGESSDGQVFYETVTFCVSGVNDPPSPENDVSTVREGNEAASCVL